jgi:diguanylate cyclase (GGDEF)-like protein
MARLLVALAHRENCRLLQQLLSDVHEVLIAETAEDLDLPFDLGILDGVTLSHYQDAIEARRSAEHPVVLPVLLLTGGSDTAEILHHLWRTIDEVIHVPIDRVELRARVEILLRMRAMSVELQERYEAEQKLADTDDVTGFFNVRYLYRYLGEWLTIAAADRSNVSLAFVDMDRFKAIVDTYGHLSGSKVLKEVAELFGSLLDEDDRLIHYGGDEYVIVLPRQDKQSGLAKLQQLRTALKGARFLEAEGLNIPAEASFGIATYPDDAQDLRSLLAAADQMLFHSKEQGKDRITAR